MNLSIIIPVFNKKNFTESCLKDLSHLPSKNHEIIVVDNDSSDGTADIIKNFNVNYIKNHENLGFGKACNIGYHAAKFENVCFLNNDIRVKSNHQNWTDVIFENIDEGLFSPTYGTLRDDFSFIKEVNPKEKMTLDIPNSYLSGWCLAGAKKTFDSFLVNKNQVFREDFFAYFEDTDLSFRAKEFKIKLVCSPIPVVHFGKQTSSQLNTFKLYMKSREIFLKLWNK